MLINPASLTEFERRRVDANLYLVWEKIQVDPHGPLGNPFDGGINADALVHIPSAGAVFPLRDGKGAWAVGFYPIGGGAVEYDHARSSVGRLLFGNDDRKLALRHMQFAGAYARKLGNGWSVGVGAQVSLTRLRTDQLTLNLRPADADNSWDHAWGIGFNLGVYKEFGEKFAVGAMYKSRQWSEPFDDYRDLAPKTLDYPHTFRIGAAWMPNDRWTFTADYEYAQWSSVPPFGEDVLSSGLDWGDVHSYKAGVEWKAIPDKLTLMAGVSINNTPIKGNNLFVNLFNPTLIEEHVTAGLSWEFKPDHSVHFVYAASLQNSVTQRFEGDILNRLGLGTELTVSGDSIAIGYSWEF